jgi:hypothetical protein
MIFLSFLSTLPFTRLLVLILPLKRLKKYTFYHCQTKLEEENQTCGIKKTLRKLP